MKIVALLICLAMYSCCSTYETTYEIRGDRPLENRGWEDDDDLEVVPVVKKKSCYSKKHD